MAEARDMEFQDTAARAAEAAGGEELGELSGDRMVLN
jgi:hypothetical protein